MHHVFHPAPAVPAGLPYQSCVDLLQSWLDQRSAIVQRLEQLLNCQKQPAEFQQDAQRQARLFKDCFAAASPLALEQAGLVERLEQAHWASGFKPRANPGNDLIDPVQMLLRGLHLWRQTRWPGGRGRLRFAHTLYNLYLLRMLAWMTMRVWDEGAAGVTARLQQLQALLDRLWRDCPADQPRLLRDVRWLVPVVLSPTTDELWGYFGIAGRLVDTFTEADLLETHKAWVVTGAGHLRAQLRALCLQRGVGLDDQQLVLLTRRSNALDLALLVQGLVPLLEAYERSLNAGDEPQRLALAQAVYQGFSPDPELFVQRLDLLGAYGMMDYVFVGTNAAGQAQYTAAGQRHLQLQQRYEALLQRLAQPLLQDCQYSQSQEGGYSPCGALYGFASNLLELMSYRCLLPEPAAPFGMEDVFTSGDAAKRAWVNDWRKLPHIKAEVVQQFAYQQQFVDEVGARVERALQQRVTMSAPVACGRLHVGADEALQRDAIVSGLPTLPLRFIESSDAQLVAAGKAVAKDEGDLLHCRLEGEYVVSYQTPGGWVGLSKDLLTDALGAGHELQLAGLPQAAARALQLLCPGLVRVLA